MMISKVYTIGKISNYVRLFALLLIWSVITISCTKDTATNDPRDNIIDTWNCQENSTVFSLQSYTVDISKSSTDSTKVLIDNFYHIGAGYRVSAKLSGLSLSISKQTVGGFDIMSGSGTISSNYKTITWTYKVDDGSGQIDNVTATYSRIQ